MEQVIATNAVHASHMRTMDTWFANNFVYKRKVKEMTERNPQGREGRREGGKEGWSGGREGR